MKNFKTVLGFQLSEFFKSKGFVVTTVLLALVAVVGMFIPRFIDLGFDKPFEAQVEDMLKVDESEVVFYDSGKVLSEEAIKSVFPKAIIAATEEEATNMVEQKKVDKGFIITGPTSYKIVVYNKDMFEKEGTVVSQMLSSQVLGKYALEHQLDVNELTKAMGSDIKTETVVLGNNRENNYWYCYALVIIIFMMIMIYGTMIATTVASEKSNRSIEVLVTSTSTNSLLFGKVIAGAIAGVFQMALILGGLLFSYSLNRELWGGKLDMFLNIPGDVLLVFALFGLGGYLFFAFIYGAVGALVSKTEDVSKSSSGIMMAVMIIYFLSLIQLSNIDGIIMKVLSFLPFSSYSAMFSRVAMDSVSTVEVVISFAILVVSIIGAGLLASKIYRMGTLRYGNPIKFSTAIKDLKKQ